MSRRSYALFCACLLENLWAGLPAYVRCPQSAFFNRDKVPRIMARIELTRARDLLFGILEHFLPLCEPSDGSRNGKKNSEHLRLETESLIDDSRIEIDV